MTDYRNFQFNGNLELDNPSYNYCLQPNDVLWSWIFKVKSLK